MTTVAPSVGVAPASSTSFPSQSSKPLRVLACVLCQQRKVKCNRQFPCSNCIKFRAQCVPATLAPRRRRRRFPERELLDRLRQYEGLLRRNNIKFEPLQRNASGETVSPNVEDGSDSDDDHQDSAGRDLPSPSTMVTSEGVHEPKYARPKELSGKLLMSLGTSGTP